jgi:hypothetical protein
MADANSGFVFEARTMLVGVGLLVSRSRDALFHAFWAWSFFVFYRLYGLARISSMLSLLVPGTIQA